MQCSNAEKRGYEQTYHGGCNDSETQKHVEFSLSCYRLTCMFPTGSRSVSITRLNLALADHVYLWATINYALRSASQNKI